MKNSQDRLIGETPFASHALVTAGFQLGQKFRRTAWQTKSDPHRHIAVTKIC